MKVSAMENNAISFTMLTALLLGLAMMLLSSCASMPDQSLVGSYYPLVGSEEGSMLNLPAERYKVTKEEGYFSVWDRELKTSVKVCITDSAVSRAYSSYSEGRGWNVTSKEETPVALRGGAGKGLFVKEKIEINGHHRMMVRGEAPGLVVLEHSGKNRSTEGKAVFDLLQYWSTEMTDSGIAVAD